MSNDENIPELIEALQSHRINSLAELRQIEILFASIGTPEVQAPMTLAWHYYVESNMLLTELRGLTRNYPFSSECVDEAKRRVYADPSSDNSWNLCWLVLQKIQNDQLIMYYASMQARQPAMWGGHTPSQEHVLALATAFFEEWNWAVEEMLRHWEYPPTGQ